jgi:hypothetical protein
MSKTKDEQYVLWLYRIAKEAGDPEKAIDRYEVGTKVGLHSRGVNAICKLLIKANFIRKVGEEEVRLTPHGLSLAERLLHEV